MSSKSDTNKRWVPSDDYRKNFDRLFGDNKEEEEIKLDESVKPKVD